MVHVALQVVMQLFMKKEMELTIVLCQQLCMEKVEETGHLATLT